MRRRIVGLVVLLLIFLAVTVAIVWPKRPPRQELMAQLFRGVHYSRQVRSSPRPLMIHSVKIDITSQGIDFLVTPGVIGYEREYLAQTTTDFVSEYQVQVGINGGFFEPFYSRSPFHYYPHRGDLVDVMGVAIANGTVYSADRPERPRLCVGKRGITLQIGDCGLETEQALTGKPMLVEGGEIKVQTVEPGDKNLHPRTAIGIDEQAQTMWFVVIDGRQKGYSEGVTLYELAEIMVDLGVAEALNLDGGGSSTLVINRGGLTEILNAPYHTRIPMRERPVGNHLGVYAGE